MYWLYVASRWGHFSVTQTGGNLGLATLQHPQHQVSVHPAHPAHPVYTPVPPCKPSSPPTLLYIVIDPIWGININLDFVWLADGSSFQLINSENLHLIASWRCSADGRGVLLLNEFNLNKFHCVRAPGKAILRRFLHSRYLEWLWILFVSTIHVALQSWDFCVAGYCVTERSNCFNCSKCLIDVTDKPRWSPRLVDVTRRRG